METVFRKTGIIAFETIYFLLRSLSIAGTGSCRFVPNCSHYARQALLELPPLTAGIKIIWRVVRCNPLCKGGFDPVTPTQKGP